VTTTEHNPTVQFLLDLCDAKKADNIVSVRLKTTPFVDFIILCTAQNNIQIKAIGMEITKAMKEGNPLILEAKISGDANSGWMIIEVPGIVAVHVALQPIRDYYDLDGHFARRAIGYHL
jgi:ribosome silencing factor RsfS/YbeB/iojap